MPRLLKPTQEIEQPQPLTPEMRETLDRSFGPVPEPQAHPLPEDFEEKRQAELEKMGLGNGQKDAWQPDLRVTQSLGLQGTTAAALAEELQSPPVVVVEEPDINAQLEKFFENEREIPLVPQEEPEVEERDPHLVPLEEQVTEEEGEERERPLSLLQQVSRKEEEVQFTHHGFPKTEGYSWSDWLDPQTATAPLHRFSLTADGDTLALVLQPDHQLATVTAEALAALGKRCAFPPEFVGKLPAVLAAEIANDRISVADNHDMTVLLQDGKWTAILPAWRGIVPFRVACDVVYDTLAQHYSGIGVSRLETNGSLHLRLLTPVAYPVTEGDTLQMGVDLTFSYNTTLTVSLLVRRQDGAEMTAYPQAFSWRARTGDAGSAERQLEWLQNAVLYVIGMYMEFVGNANKMADVHVTEYLEGIKKFALYLGIPKKLIPAVVSASDTLHTNSNWGIIGALAHFALDYAEQAELQAALGDYVANWSVE